MQFDISTDWQIRVLSSVNQARDVFDQCDIDSPFLQFSFWQALEQSGVIGGETDWQISHLLAVHQQQPVAWMPLFIKQEHRGEYVFDHGWAEAYFRHGLDYYPRLVTSIPFTPVPDQRVLCVPGYSLAQVWPVLFEVLTQLSEQQQASSWHGLFIDTSLKDVATSQQLAVRHNCQFLWTNQGYQQFDDFLAKLTAKKRKSIKVERERLKQQDVVCSCIEGNDITAEQWQFFYQCYVNTYHERGQQPYLNLAFFQMIAKAIPEHLMLVIASRQHEPMASALFFKDTQHLYGRYWGAVQQVDYLHFEVCYYQGIDYAIRQHLQYFDPGTQGEHKLIRGFDPIYTYSAHWMRHAGFMRAVGDFCQQESRQIQAYHQAAQASSPYKQIRDE